MHTYGSHDILLITDFIVANIYLFLKYIAIKTYSNVNK